MPDTPLTFTHTATDVRWSRGNLPCGAHVLDGDAVAWQERWPDSDGDLAVLRGLAGVLGGIAYLGHSGATFQRVDLVGATGVLLAEVQQPRPLGVAALSATPTRWLLLPGIARPLPHAVAAEADLTCLLHTEDLQTLVFAGRDASLLVLGADDQVVTPPVSARPPARMALSTDGCWLVTAHREGVIRIWETRTGTEAATHRLERIPRSVSLSATTINVQTDEGTVTLPLPSP